jgi:hypothetical protein
MPCIFSYLKLIDLIYKFDISHRELSIRDFPDAYFYFTKPLLLGYINVTAVVGGQAAACIVFIPKGFL